MFAKNSDVFGTDVAPYRHHVHRVVGLVCRQVDVEPKHIRPLAVAAFFHDAAIWFDQTWDYLPRSAKRAVAELADDEAEHAELVTAMIYEHHRVRKARHRHPLVEAFRLADRADVFAPLVGVPRVDVLRAATSYAPSPIAAFAACWPRRSVAVCARTQFDHCR